MNLLRLITFRQQQAPAGPTPIYKYDAGDPTSYPGTGTTWFDISGNANNATLVNGVGYSTFKGGALVCDGADDYITLVPGTYTSYTASFWIYSVNSQTQSWILDASTASPYGLQGFELRSGVTDNVGYRESNLTRLPWDGSGNTTDLKYYDKIKWNFSYVTFVSDGVDITCYVNGVSYGYITPTPGETLPIRTILQERANLGFQGFLFYADFYNSALTSAQINTNYNSLLSRYSFPNSMVTSGLVLGLDAGDPTSYPGTGTTWFDTSGNANNATWTTGVTYNSANSGHFDLASSTMTVLHNASLDVGANITVSAWVNSPSGGTKIIATKSPVTLTPGWEHLISAATNRAQFRASVEGPAVASIIGPAEETNWVMLTWTYDGATIKNYTNGYFYGQTAVVRTALTLNSSADITIGWRLGFPSALSNLGKLSNIQIYDRPLTNDEIWQNYFYFKPRFY